MTRKARSARGNIVDFDLLTIKQQLAVTPVPPATEMRRRFIDEKDGIKVKEPVQKASALALALEAAEESANAIEAEQEELDVEELEEVKTTKSTKK